MLKQIVIVGLGGLLGAILRYSITFFWQTYIEPIFRNAIEKIVGDSNYTSTTILQPSAFLFKLFSVLNLPPGVWSTVIINWLGCFGLGVFLKSRAVDSSASEVAWFSSVFFIQIGIFGSLTTFSSFIGDIFKLSQRENIVSLVVYLLFQLLGGLVLFLLGQRVLN